MVVWGIRGGWSIGTNTEIEVLMYASRVGRLYLATVCYTCHYSWKRGPEIFPAHRNNKYVGDGYPINTDLITHSMYITELHIYSINMY